MGVVWFPRKPLKGFVLQTFTTYGIRSGLQWIRWCRYTCIRWCHPHRFLHSDRDLIRTHRCLKGVKWNECRRKCSLPTLSCNWHSHTPYVHWDTLTPWFAIGLWRLSLCRTLVWDLCSNHLLILVCVMLLKAFFWTQFIKPQCPVCHDFRQVSRMVVFWSVEEMYSRFDIWKKIAKIYVFKLVWPY